MTTIPFITPLPGVRPNAQEAVSLNSKRFLQATLDALSAHIAILDEHGTIIKVNAAWNRFARENDFKGRYCGVGDSYLGICDSACGSFSEGASAVGDGIRAIMAGQRDEFHLEYPCHSAEERRWFIVRATRFDDDGRVRVVVAHENITERKRAEEALKEQLGLRERLAKIAANVPGIIYAFRLRPDGSICLPYGSPTMEDFFGVRAEDLVEDASSLLNLVLPADQARLHDSIAESARRLTSWRCEFRFRHPKKGLFWVEGQSTPEREADGSILWHGFMSDISGRKQAETALQTSMEEFRTLAESMPQMVWVTRADGWNIYFSQQWMDYTGLTVEDSLGHGWNKPFHLDDKQQAWDAWQQATATGGIYSIESRLRRADGVYRWWLVRGVPMRDASGNILKWFGTCTDIHDLKHTETALARLAAIVESSEDAIIGKDLHGLITSWNKGAEEIFGYTSGEILATSIMRLIPAEQQDEEKQILEKIKVGDSVAPFETLRQAKNGRLMDVSVSVSPIKDRTGQIIGVSKVARDITERKRVTRQLTELKLNEERTRRALEHERELNETKSRFVSMVSHEFRTPLCVIGMAGSLLGRYSDKMTGDERSRQIEGIKTSVERMTQMMEDLLLHEGFEAGKMECKPGRMDIEALCRRLILEASNQASAFREIEFAIDPAARELLLDERIFRHILANLLSNAVKYSSEGQRVRLEVNRIAIHTLIEGDSNPSPKDQIQLKVSDAGVGIPAADLSRLFQTFHRASNVGNRPGTGIGLVIVKQFVELHQGTIRVESIEGKGTTVWVWLPIVSPDPAKTN